MGLYDGLRVRPGAGGARVQPDFGVDAPQPLTPVDEWELTKGLRRGTQGVFSNVRGFKAAFQDPFSPEAAAENYRIARENMAQVTAENPLAVENFTDIKRPGDVLPWAGGAFGQGFPTTVAALGTGLGARVGMGALRGVAGLAGKKGLQAALSHNLLNTGIGMGAGILPQEGGEQAMNIQADPVAMANSTAGGRLANVLGKGAANTVLEEATPMFLLGKFGKEAVKGVGRGWGNAAKAIGTAAGEGWLGETGTEGLQNVSGDVFTGMLNPQHKIDWKAALNAAAAGGLVGTGLGGAAGAGQATLANLPGASRDAEDRTVGDVLADATIGLQRKAGEVSEKLKGASQAKADKMGFDEMTSHPDFDTMLKGAQDTAAPDWAQKDAENTQLVDSFVNTLTRGSHPTNIAIDAGMLQGLTDVAKGDFHGAVVAYKMGQAQAGNDAAALFQNKTAFLDKLEQLREGKKFSTLATRIAPETKSSGQAVRGTPESKLADLQDFGTQYPEEVQLKAMSYVAGKFPHIFKPSLIPSHDMNTNELKLALVKFARAGFSLGNNDNELPSIFQDAFGNQAAAVIRATASDLHDQGMISEEAANAGGDLATVIGSKVKFDNAFAASLKEKLTGTFRDHFADTSAQGVMKELVAREREVRADPKKEAALKADLSGWFGKNADEVRAQLAQYEEQTLGKDVTAQGAESRVALSDEDIAADAEAAVKGDIGQITDWRRPSIDPTKVTWSRQYNTNYEGEQKELAAQKGVFTSLGSAVRDVGAIDYLREQHEGDPEALRGAISAFIKQHEKSIPQENHASPHTYLNKVFRMLRAEDATGKSEALDIPGEEFNSLNPKGDNTKNVWAVDPGWDVKERKIISGGAEHGYLWFERAERPAVEAQPERVDTATGEIVPEVKGRKAEAATQFMTRASKIIGRMYASTKGEPSESDKDSVQKQYDLLMRGISSLLDSRMADGSYALTGRVGVMENGQMRWLTQPRPGRPIEESTQATGEKFREVSARRAASKGAKQLALPLNFKLPDGTVQDALRITTPEKRAVRQKYVKRDEETGKEAIKRGTDAFDKALLPEMTLSDLREEYAANEALIASAKERVASAKSINDKLKQKGILAAYEARKEMILAEADKRVSEEDVGTTDKEAADKGVSETAEMAENEAKKEKAKVREFDENVAMEGALPLHPAPVREKTTPVAKRAGGAEVTHLGKGESVPGTTEASLKALRDLKTEQNRGEREAKQVNMLVTKLREGVLPFLTALRKSAQERQDVMLGLLKRLSEADAESPVWRGVELTKREMDKFKKAARVVLEKAKTPEAAPVQEVKAAPAKKSSEVSGAERASQAEVDETVAEFERTVGDAAAVAFVQEGLIENGKHISGRWRKRLIEISMFAKSPVGTLRHEVIHELFDWLKDNGSTATIEALKNAGTNTILLGKLKMLFKDDAQATKQLSNPEEAAAYLYQFWNARNEDGTRMIELGPQTETVFRKILRVLAKLFGLSTNHMNESRNAELIFEALSKGEFVGKNDAAMNIIEKKLAGSKLLREQRSAYDKGFTDNPWLKNLLFRNFTVLRDSGSKYLKETGELFYKPFNERMKAGEQDQFSAVKQMANKYGHEVNRLYMGLTQGDKELLKQELELAVTYMNSRTPLNEIVHPQVRQFVRGARKLFQDMHAYARHAGVSVLDEKGAWKLIGEIKDYYPRQFDPSYLQGHLKEFTDKLIKHHADELDGLVQVAEQERLTQTFTGKYAASNTVPAGTPITREHIAGAIATQILNSGGDTGGESISGIGITPYASAVNHRSLLWLDDAAFAEFMSKDMLSTMLNYVHQMVKRAEATRRSGNGGEKIRQNFDRAYVEHLLGPEMVKELEKELEGQNKSLTDKYGYSATVMAHHIAAHSTMLQKTTAELKADSASRAKRETSVEHRLTQAHIDVAKASGLGKIKLQEQIDSLLFQQDMMQIEQADVVEELARRGKDGDKSRIDAKYHDLRSLANTRLKGTPVELQAKIKKTNDFLADPMRVVMAMEGTLGRDIDAFTRNILQGAKAYQSIRLLPLTLFTSFSDVGGLVTNGAKVTQAFEAFTRGIKDVARIWVGKPPSMDVAAAIGGHIGLLEAGSHLSAVSELNGSIYEGSPIIRKINDTFFRWNGMEAWNRAMRLMGGQFAMDFVKRHLQNPGVHSRRLLEDIGIDLDKDYFLKEDLYDPNKKVSDTSRQLWLKAGELDINNPVIQHAIMRWVDGAVMNPNAAQRPTAFSDPHYDVFFQFKQFTYTFHSAVIERVMSEAEHGNLTPFISMMAVYAPIIVAADLIRGVLTSGDEPVWARSIGGIIEHAVTRVGPGGIPQMIVGDLPIVGKGHPARSLGPTIDQAIGLSMAALTSEGSLPSELLGALPAGNVARGFGPKVPGPDNIDMGVTSDVFGEAAVTAPALARIALRK